LHLSKISLGTYCSQRLSAISPGFEIGEDVLDYVFRVEEGHGEIWIDGIVSPAQVECESPWRDQEMT